jgi:hypothetical protein
MYVAALKYFCDGKYPESFEVNEWEFKHLLTDRHLLMRVEERDGKKYCVALRELEDAVKAMEEGARLELHSM